MPADVLEERKLRLASAQRKVRSFLAQISALEASDFAHPDAEAALSAVKARFTQSAKRLDQLRPDSRTLNNRCKHVIEDAQHYTNILGIILRSSNVRNPFEVYYALRLLVQRIIPGVKLVISSEWDWSPFTYPVGRMENFIFIGSPATESDNVLLVPLAGHEIGYFAWSHHEVYDNLRGEASDFLDAELAGVQLPTDLTQEQPDLRQWVFDTAMAQVEEVFCDFVGLYIFSEFYLYAYCHILAPGGLYRDECYPDALDRVTYLRAAAHEWSITYPSNLFEAWQRSDQDDPETALALADEVVRRMISSVIEQVGLLLSGAEVPRTDEAKVAAIEAAVADSVPFGERARLSEILCAGWRVLERQRRPWSAQGKL